jgi:glycosyltransferase involved in cell wall biosynthesis
MLSVSAIVPTCDRPDLLNRALQSIYAQEHAPLEIIVVDDTGADHCPNTRRRVEEWDFPEVQVIPNSHGKGVSGARNTGAELAAGELLAFLDDDDEWLPAYLSEALQQFESNHLDVLCGDLLCQFDDGIDRTAKSAPEKLRPEIFLTRNPGFGGSNLILRKMLYLDIGGFDESLPTAEDMDLGLKLSLRGDVRYERLPKRLVRAHQHKGPKLCTPAGAAMRAGIRRFYQLHSHRMTAGQRAEFRANARYHFGLDEYGNNLNLASKTRADLLITSLKSWLDKKRQEIL